MAVIIPSTKPFIPPGFFHYPSLAHLHAAGGHLSWLVIDPEAVPARCKRVVADKLMDGRVLDFSGVKVHTAVGAAKHAVAPWLALRSCRHQQSDFFFFGKWVQFRHGFKASHEFQMCDFLIKELDNLVSSSYSSFSTLGTHDAGRHNKSNSCSHGNQSLIAVLARLLSGLVTDCFLMQWQDLDEGKDLDLR